ncbi:MAG TPA: alpha-L-fucosidase [Vicinamibacterales bacterium]|nr:alpha-L-fucosidase [Vicinamibacterales bacterium]
MNRRTFLAGGAAWLGAGLVSRLAAQAQRPRPSPSQLAWQRDELALFLHFGVNTFTDREWGDGKEDPSIFAPSALDARQWARVARASGFRAVILTAKHHDGFCLWPTRTTKHSVASSPWRAGQGDLVKEFVAACRGEGLRPGLYLSPWDRNNPLYGDSPRYNDLYVDQLRELLTNYGDIHEVWFDGANGEGPNGRKQEYDWPRVWGEVRKLQPKAVMFSDAGPDVRWCGNESGSAGDPNWSTVDAKIVPVPGMPGKHIIDALQHGQADGPVWRPAECDTSIRPGWFHHPAEDGRVRSADRLMDLYFRSVGHNGKLLLNVPPTRDGVLHATDVARLQQFAERRREVFANDFARARRVRWSRSGPTTASGVLDIGRPRSFSIVRLEEPIEEGQTVARYSIHGAGSNRVFKPLAKGTTIGYARLDRVVATDVRYVRVDIEEAVAAPEPLRVRLFA